MPAPHWAAAARQAGQSLLDGKDAAGLKALCAEAFEPLIAAAGPASLALDRLAILPVSDAVRARLAAIGALVAGLPDINVTIDPTERHGFEYQTWIGFSLFGAGIMGETGRGGAYATVRPDGSAEPAIGFSLYIDGLVDAGLGISDPRRVLLPVGTDPAAAAGLRADGWATVVAFTADARPGDFRCSHVWDGVKPAKT
ncbi:MAG: ATP phosphoribosyltransferase regulatory subunit [Sandarakinorhabdus sp.]|nr:ATP phosphoribosyltransferase regulatory subunit [Sandarakinorhabdus sp.]